MHVQCMLLDPRESSFEVDCTFCRNAPWPCIHRIVHIYTQRIVSIKHTMLDSFTFCRNSSVPLPSRTLFDDSVENHFRHRTFGAQHPS